MRTNRFTTVLLSVGMLAVGPAMATTPVSVAFVNTQKVLEEAPQAAAAREKLQHEFAPRESELVAAQKRYKSLEDKLARDGEVMNETEKRKLEREIVTQQRELKRSRETFTEDVNIRRNEEISKLQREVASAIVQLAKENNYDIILESGVVYASDRVDITDQVLKRLNQQPTGKGK